MDEKKDREVSLSRQAEGTTIDRRDFIKALGGGIVILFWVGPPAALPQQRHGQGSRPGYPTDFNAYLRIAEDGAVTCFTGKVELGQGVNTSLAQVAAEELDVPFASIQMVLGDTAVCPWDMGTFGSMSIKYFSPALRKAAAEAREVLILLGAERLGVPLESVRTEDGYVFVGDQPEQRVSYGALAGGKTIAKRLESEAALTPTERFTVYGKATARTDALEKVTAAAKYAGDERPEGLLHARILRPPAHGAKLVGADTSAAEKIEGVRIVRDGDLVAVLHPSFDVADLALSRIKARFETPESTLDEESIFAHLEKAAPEGRVNDERGDLGTGRSLAAKVLEGTYHQGYVAHAPIEPHTAVAKIEGDKVTVWASTQRPFGVQPEVAQALGMPAESVRVITPYVGGGFGGKNQNQQAVEAAMLAQATGKPVQVAWSRAEEFFFDTFQPAAVVKIGSGLDSSGRIVFWDYQVLFAGGRSAQPLYDIPHLKVVERGSWSGAPTDGAHPFRTGAWRGPGSNTNTFAMESHIDAMAAAAGIDPVEFRLHNLKNDRMKAVLLAAADKFGWTPAAAPGGRGYGAACADYNGTYVAICAQVRLDKSGGRITVERIVIAQDMGLVVNPAGAKAQMEGCVTMGLGYVLSEEIRFKGGDIRTRNFDTYGITRFSWAPKIETVLIDNPDMEPQGGGEPGIICMGAVVANALFDAAGVRVRRLPLAPERVKAALGA